MTNVLVLCAGRGQRFKDAGYKEPKPLIDVAGIPMVKRTTDSIPGDPYPGVKAAFAVLSDHVVNHSMKDRLFELYGRGIFVYEIPTVTRGNLETAYRAIDHLLGNGFWELGEPLLILDSDNAYDGSPFWSFIENCESMAKEFGAICYFEPLDDKTHWCFAQLKRDEVFNLLEKTPVALEVDGKPMVGTFYFSSAKLFRDIASDILVLGKKEKGEFYMSQAVERLLDFGISVYGCKVTDVHPLGTPEDVAKFVRGPLRIALDLDDTINHCKKPNEEYGNEALQEGVIETLRKWKKQGHYIIIHTARHVRTCDGNLGKVLARQGLTTLQWLDENNIPYDELWWSKPHADIFIDDKGLRHTPGDWRKTADLVERFSRGEDI